MPDVAEAASLEEPAEEPTALAEPATEEPVAEEASPEEPAVEEPAVEEPAAEEPLVEEPPVEELFGPIEAILLIVDEPLLPVTLAQVLDRPRPVIEEALRTLSTSYTEQGRGFELREVAGGWRLYTREEYAEVVERFVLDGQQAKLTNAALETLAVVAYRQPVSRARVSAIRGVNCDGVMRTLVTRGLVEEAGTDGESGATLYRTTSYFLERLGIRSLEELPNLAPYLPEIDEMESEQVAPESAAPESPATELAATDEPATADAAPEPTQETDPHE
ncbi:SMC-Scp complex subunit ScpB [Actinopolymorpha alba]|uniref:SMC-Scp complex subunit ScpB n=1 Tax=Actinopolymorpha alba TaxID=533267 RepID=UPI00037BEABB